MPPTSIDLIEQALGNGTIDAETALIYEVYAAFGDPTLPAEYRGDYSTNPLQGEFIMSKVADEWPSLSAETQAALEPFFVPPAFPGSWTDKFDSTSQTASSASSGFTLSPLIQQESLGTSYPVPSPVPKEGWVPNGKLPGGNDAPVVVWYRTEDPAGNNEANAILANIGTIWDKLHYLMKVEPLDDTAFVNEYGIDDRIDIYICYVPQLLESTKQSTTLGVDCTFAPDKCAPAPSFIVLNPIYVTQDADLVGTLVHELMHAFQRSYSYAKGCSSYLWWWEATAEWAVDYVYPTAVPPVTTAYEADKNPEWSRLPAFFTHASSPLDDATEVDGVELYYSRYVFPFFLWHMYGAVGDSNVIRNIFINDGSLDSLTAIDTTLKQMGCGGLEKVWPLFEEYNWNRPPLQYYKDWDNIQRGMKTEDFALPSIVKDYQYYNSVYNNIDLSGQPEQTYKIVPSDVEHLAAKYYDFRFDDDNSRSFVFLNGFSYHMSSGPAAFDFLQTSQAYRWDISSNGNTTHTVPGASVRALVDIGGDWEWRDWTDKPYVFFARDTTAERIQELVLVFSNSNTQSDITPGGLPSTIVFSNMGSWQYTGTWREVYHQTYNGYDVFNLNEDITITDDLTFERIPWTPFDKDQLADTPLANLSPAMISSYVDIFNNMLRFNLKQNNMSIQYAGWDDCGSKTEEWRKLTGVQPDGELDIMFPIYSGGASRRIECADNGKNYQEDDKYLTTNTDCDNVDSDSGWISLDPYKCPSLGWLSSPDSTIRLDADGSIHYQHQETGPDYGSTITLTLTPQRQ